VAVSKSAFAIGLLLLACCGAEEPRPLSPTRTSTAEAEEPLEIYYAYKLEKFYKRKTAGDPWANNPRWLAAVSRSVVKWTRAFELEARGDYVLAMMHRESWMNPEAPGAGREWGLMQIHPSGEPWIFPELARRGLPRINKRDPDHQIAAGVCELWLKIKWKRGNFRKAVKAYNGSGPKAEEYLRKVDETRREIFR
jgi:soluble lytic murein transglycosylase-like protein